METQPKRKSRLFPGFVFGMIVGALLIVVGPKWWRSYVPDLLLPGGSVDGKVLEKSKEDGRLLLRIETNDGVLLATFTEQLEEIDLLVEKGDDVTLRVPRYEPFLTDPRLGRVRKGSGAAPGEPSTTVPPTAPSMETPSESEEPEAATEPETTTTVPL